MEALLRNHLTAGCGTGREGAPGGSRNAGGGLPMQSININFKMFLSEGTAVAGQRNEHCHSGPTRVLGQMLKQNSFQQGIAWFWGSLGAKGHPLVGSRMGTS